MEREPAWFPLSERFLCRHAALTATLFLLSATLKGADCNRNGTPDDLDLSPRLDFEATLVLGGAGSVAAGDLDGDGRIDLAGTSAEGFRTLLNRGLPEFAMSLTRPGGEA